MIVAFMFNYDSIIKLCCRIDLLLHRNTFFYILEPRLSGNLSQYGNHVRIPFNKCCACLDVLAVLRPYYCAVRNSMALQLSALSVIDAYLSIPVKYYKLTTLLRLDNLKVMIFRNAFIFRFEIGLFDYP